MSATTTLILIVEHLISKVSDDDGALTNALSAFKTELANDETAMGDLTARVAALEEAKIDLTPFNDSIAALDEKVAALEQATSPAPVDLTALTDRVDALEARNTADDAAAGAVVLDPATGAVTPDPAVITLGGLSPADATVGEAYSAIIATSGGVAPLSFSILSGALPDGLSLSAGGAVLGTPTAAGDFEVAIQAHDANGTVGQAVYHLIVAEAAPVAQDATAEAPAPDAPVEAEATA